VRSLISLVCHHDNWQLQCSWIKAVFDLKMHVQNLGHPSPKIGGSKLPIFDVLVVSELRGSKLRWQSARQAVIGQRPSRNFPNYPLVIKLPCRRVLHSAVRALHYCHCNVINKFAFMRRLLFVCGFNFVITFHLG